MHPNEFCYWLQGAIEIGSLSRVGKEEAEIIIGMLEKVAPHDLFTLSTLLMFRDFESQSVFEDVRSSLQKKFIHDIDPSYEGDQQYFNDLHAGAKVHLS